jgi:hypothetical protein
VTEARQQLAPALQQGVFDSMEYKDAQGSGWYRYVDPRAPKMQWWRQSRIKRRSASVDGHVFLPDFHYESLQSFALCC